MVPRDPTPEKSSSIALANEIHAAWDQAWPKIGQAIDDQGLEVICNKGCHGCCFDLKPCAQCEGLLIANYVREEFSLEQQEHFRSRVECAVGSLRKLRKQGYGDSADEFARCGGLECPFLERGCCAIYPVRPLACRSMVYAAPQKASVNTALCRQCPASVVFLEAQVKRGELQASMDEREPSTDANTTIAERLSGLWECGTVRPPTDKLTSKSWKVRLKSRESWFDQTWRDDGFDWQVVKFPLVLPEEGEYPPDLVVLRASPSAHEVYGETVQANDLIELRVLYKLLPGGHFNWKQRVFEIDQDESSHIVWMGDSIQERLMMWEAAKRCRGHVLCGGLGMGIFPQFALSMRGVSSVHVVEMDPAVISLIESNWAQKTWPRRSECSISPNSIEEFLKGTDERFDTVYIDTWDALTYEYLPHVNYLKELARKTLKPSGEVLLWGYDLMVRLALRQAGYILSRREYFLAADEQQLNTLDRQQPLFHKMLSWFIGHPACSRDDFFTETYRLATTWKKDMGRLSLDRIGET